MSRVYVGNLDPRTTERDLEDEFRVFGVLRSVWVARKPPGYAFIEFDDQRDAVDAIRALNGKSGWRVEMSRSSRGGGGGRGRGGGEDLKCYECGEPGHFARECRLRIGAGGLGSGRRRSPSPRYRRSPSYGRSVRSPRYSPGVYETLTTGRRHLSYSPSYDKRCYSPSPSYGGSSYRRSRSPSYSLYWGGYGDGYRYWRYLISKASMSLMYMIPLCIGVAVLDKAILLDAVATHRDGGEVTAGHLRFDVIVGSLHMLMVGERRSPVPRDRYRSRS